MFFKVNSIKKVNRFVSSPNLKLAATFFQDNLYGTRDAKLAYFEDYKNINCSPYSNIVAFFFEDNLYCPHDTKFGAFCRS